MSEQKVLLEVENAPNGFKCVLCGVDISGYVKGLDISCHGTWSKVDLSLILPTNYLHKSSEN